MNTEFEVAEGNKKNKKSFSFPEGGWVCRPCQNYNFAHRNTCHRCKKQVDTNDFKGVPKHLLVPQSHKENVKEDVISSLSLTSGVFVPTFQPAPIVTKTDKVEVFVPESEPKANKRH